MTGDPDPPTDRESPVGEPVVRGDERVTGEHSRHAVAFDPDDPDSVVDAAATAAAFARDELGDTHVDMLRGAAACAALVRAEHSYKAAAERAGSDVGVSFVRKWARVHDLPRPIRRQVAGGHIPPSAAKHIARVDGADRYLLAWAVVDHDLTVRDVRAAASAVSDGVDPVDALRALDVTPGELPVSLPLDVYRDLRRHATATDRDIDDVVTAALRDYLA